MNSLVFPSVRGLSIVSSGRPNGNVGLGGSDLVNDSADPEVLATEGTHRAPGSMLKKVVSSAVSQTLQSLFSVMRAAKVPERGVKKAGTPVSICLGVVVNVVLWREDIKGTTEHTYISCCCGGLSEQDLLYLVLMAPSSRLHRC